MLLYLNIRKIRDKKKDNERYSTNHLSFIFGFEIPFFGVPYFAGIFELVYKCDIFSESSNQALDYEILKLLKYDNF